MKAYIINGTDIYAANSSREALELHESITDQRPDECESEEADLSMKIIEEGEDEKPASVRTIGEVLSEMTEPGYIGEYES